VYIYLSWYGWITLTNNATSQDYNDQGIAAGNHTIRFYRSTDTLDVGTIIVNYDLGGKMRNGSVLSWADSTHAADLNISGATGTYKYRVRDCTTPSNGSVTTSSSTSLNITTGNVSPTRRAFIEVIPLGASFADPVLNPDSCIPPSPSVTPSISTPYYTIQASNTTGGAGVSIDGDGSGNPISRPAGTYSLVAIPDAGYTFSNWYFDSGSPPSQVASFTNASTYIVVAGNCVIHAVFTPIPSTTAAVTPTVTPPVTSPPVTPTPSGTPASTPPSTPSVTPEVTPTPSAICTIWQYSTAGTGDSLVLSICSGGGTVIVYDGDQYCTIGPDTPPAGPGGSWSYIGTCSGSYPLPSDTPPITPTPTETPAVTPTPFETPSVTPEPSISTTPDVSITPSPEPTPTVTPSPSFIPACKRYGLDWQETYDKFWEIGANFLNCSDQGDSFYFSSGPGDPGQYTFCAREDTVVVNFGSNLQNLGDC
jgi:hypothetical protein